MAVEALSRLYADKFGLSVACLRIGSFEDAPTEPRHLATWLSPRDCLGFIRAALTAPAVYFTAVYAVSANTRRFWDLEAGSTLGYTPVDNAEAFASHIPSPPDEDAPENENALQGGAYAHAEFTLRHL